MLQSGFKISGFGEDEAGELYVAKLALSVGAIYRHRRPRQRRRWHSDWWRQRTSAAAAPTTNSNSCASMRTDGDGMSNLQEYLAATNPTNANDVLRITGIQRLDSTNVLIKFTSVLARTTC